MTSFQHEPGNKNSLNNNFVNSIYEDRSGILWIGNFVGGLHKFNPRTGLFKRYLSNPDDSNSLRCNSILSIIEDKTGDLWIGTQTGGVNKYDPQTEKFKLIGRRRQISKIYPDRSGDLWFASMGGLIKYNQETEEITTYDSNPTDSHSISNRHVSSIHESVSGDIWVGTQGGGLNQFDRNTEKFTHYSVEDGLASNFVLGILEDEQNNLWLSTNKGLSKFNTKTKEIRNYNRHDGLISEQFSEGAYYKSKKGEMFFGTSDGLITFYPDQIMDNPEIPSVYITDFHVFNKPVPLKSDMKDNTGLYALPQNITTLSEIELSYEENIFSFEFAALDYHSPLKNQYAYKMENVDPDWVFTDATRRFATYTNLDPGNYIFQVKASNNNGIWNEEGTSITIIITPPWWKTNWAYSTYLILFALTLYALRTYDKKRQNLKHDLELPLTLILGPVKHLLSGEFSGNLKDLYRMIVRNGERLLQLINQLLDLSKLESGRMTLQVAKTDLVKFIKGFVLSFLSLAESKKISLKFNVKDDLTMGYVDQDKLEKIITNLLSNAFKFTPVDGTIVVNVKRHPPESPLDRGDESVSPLKKGDKGGCIEMTVTNTGPGIPQSQLENMVQVSVWP